MAKQQFFQGLAAAGGIAGGDVQSQRMAQVVAQMASMKYGRDDELEADQWGVRLTAMAGYDPRAMIGVMKVLEKASGGGGQPEFMSTHPSPANREQHIEEMIKREYPNGVPAGLKK
jgi:predicted Zn-dependent protease